MLDAGARGIDGIYAQALQDGRLRSEPDLIAAMEPIATAAPMFDAPEAVATAAALELLVPTPDSAAWTAAETLLRGTPTVTAVTLTSLSIGGSTSVLVQYSDSRDMLAWQLYQKGMTLAPTPQGLLLRRRQPGDPVVTAPVVAAPAAPTTPAATPATTPAPAEPLPAPETPQ
jgi:hypothetical protein